MILNSSGCCTFKGGTGERARGMLEFKGGGTIDEMARRRRGTWYVVEVVAECTVPRGEMLGLSHPRSLSFVVHALTETSSIGVMSIYSRSTKISTCVRLLLGVQPLDLAANSKAVLSDMLDPQGIGKVVPGSPGQELKGSD
jgi:hypothetical protein